MDVHDIGIDIIVIQSSQCSSQTGRGARQDKRHPLIEKGIISKKLDPRFILLDRPDQNPEGWGGNPFEKIKYQHQTDKNEPVHRSPATEIQKTERGSVNPEPVFPIRNFPERRKNNKKTDMVER